MLEILVSSCWIVKNENNPLIFFGLPISLFILMLLWISIDDPQIKASVSIIILIVGLFLSNHMKKYTMGTFFLVTMGILTFKNLPDK